MSSQAEFDSPGRLAPTPVSKAGFSSYRLRAAGLSIGIHLALAVMLLLFMLPILWMLSTSLKPAAQVELRPPQWIPAPFNWVNFIDFWNYGSFDRALVNSAIITFGAMLGVFVSGPFVAFGFARLQFPGRNLLFIVVLATMMLPTHVTLIPLYIIYKNIGWLNTFYPFIVPAFLGGGAFYIFLLRQFFLTIPVELEDAARIDGCNAWRIYAQIFLPLSKPALATIGIFSFISGWNDYFGPLIFLSSPKMMPITVILATFKDLEGGIQYNLVMAAAFVTVLPCLVVFFIFQEHLVGGIALTGIKG